LSDRLATNKHSRAISRGWASGSRVSILRASSTQFIRLSRRRLVERFDDCVYRLGTVPVAQHAHLALKSSSRKPAVRSGGMGGFTLVFGGNAGGFTQALAQWSPVR